MLKNATPEQCSDYVKCVIDECAPGGGFLFYNQTPLLYANDAKPENVIAAIRTANEYGRK